MDKQTRKGVDPRLVIRSALAARGLTASDVARELGVTVAAVTRVIRGEKRSRRVESALARHSGFPARELFGRRGTGATAKSAKSAKEI